MYAKLLTTNRIRKSSRGEQSLVDEVESDRARVLYNASFRRLQRKTQVFPLEDNAAVRSRLTHSLEVAHVGRFLASRLVQTVHDRGLVNRFEFTPEIEHALTVTVEVACLLHDIGNPAFGHFGESAIAKWFSARDGLGVMVDSDMRGFDGNPQGLRIVASLAGSDGKTGMNLTLTQLASTIKYQLLSSEFPGNGKGYKKFGAFETEREVIEKLREKFGLGVGQRFPLAYLMEAADDISYCLSDIEDGSEKRVVRYEEVIDDLRRGAEGDSDVSSLVDQAIEQAATARDVDRVVSFRSFLVRRFVRAAVDQYVDKHDDVLTGSLDELIDPASTEGKLLKLIKAVVRRRVYSDESIQSLELAGNSVMRGLLDYFGQLIDVPRDEFTALMAPGARVKGRDVEKRLLDLVAPSHKRFYEQASVGVDEEREKLLRAHLIADYIAGMTDPFALKVHQKLSGIRL